jgi:DNA mismatch repair protein MutL
MADIIKILPDAIANQIAAGEVIQRPASAVKELLENAVDADATSITLIVKEGGKSFIQVSDNGNGMSETDARLSFERHATSKIRQSEDLFSIRTKGFRGEALASIAAVAKVNLKTRREEDAMGTQIDIEASEVIAQEPCSANKGTVFTIRNLFYNVPARRKFLKSDSVEMRHIVDEFERIALAHPNIEFQMIQNTSVMYHLESGTFRQRIVSLYGSNYNDRLVPVEEKTDVVNITGFVVKPEFSKKTRGEQFFFVNDRFIKNSYLHHAVQTSFSDLISSDSYPGYFLHLDVNPSQIDVNIHPTKTEVKFEEERFIYAILRSSVRLALGKYNIAPTLDFDNEQAFDIPLKKNIDEVKRPEIRFNPSYNPFQERPEGGFEKIHAPEDLLIRQETSSHPQTFPDYIQEINLPSQATHGLEEEAQTFPFFQWLNKYIVAANEHGLFLIDQHRAHERILFDRLIQSMNEQKVSSQMELFPQSVQLSPSDAVLLQSILQDLSDMGFDIEPFGSDTFLIRGVPGDAMGVDPVKLLESVLQQYKDAPAVERSDKKEKLAVIVVNRMAIKSGMILNKMETEQLVVDLFKTSMPYSSPGGKPIIFSMSTEELDQKFLK